MSSKARHAFARALTVQFVMPLLQKQAVSFLHQSAAGKPLIALRLAEDFSLADVYKARVANSVLCDLRRLCAMHSLLLGARAQT